MLKNNIYNIDKEFYYTIVVKSLEKIAKEEALNRRANIPRDVIFDSKDNDYYPNSVKLSAPPTPSLNLKIRNTTKYLTWRLLILKRDNFRCQIYRTSIRDNKCLRLEVHHAKASNDICKENNVRTVKEALACKELWKPNNGFSICYNCHKDVEKLRTKLRNMFLLPRIRSPILLLM
jgi:hypothetical protein